VTWWAICATALGTYAMKAAGPVVLGGRAFPVAVQRSFTLLAVTLLAALIAISTLASGPRLVIDPRAAGVVVAIIAIRLRAPFVVVIVLAAATAALLRLA
jgi:hypothetical protein